MRAILVILLCVFGCTNGAPYMPTGEPGEPGEPPSREQIALDYGRIYDGTEVKRLDIEAAPWDLRSIERQLDTQGYFPKSERKFEYVDATVSFEGLEWKHVGLRYKGNGALFGRHVLGRKKLPLKLDFDEFEDFHPETKNQRFFGVKKLNLHNGGGDASLLRELLTIELLNESGAYAPRAAPVRVFVNGKFWGVYISIEQVDKAFLRDRFGNDTGNLYKPDGSGARLRDFIPAHLAKKTNEKEADWSDIGSLIDALNDPTSDIGEIFDVDSFLPWLAVNAVLCNLDSYVWNWHNYYLYNNPETGKFVFISWDHDNSYGALSKGEFNPKTIHTFDVDRPWFGDKPLIERVLAVPEYRERYDALVRTLLAGPLGEDKSTPGRTSCAPSSWRRNSRTWAA